MSRFILHSTGEDMDFVEFNDKDMALSHARHLQKQVYEGYTIHPTFYYVHEVDADGEWVADIEDSYSENIAVEDIKEYRAYNLIEDLKYEDIEVIVNVDFDGKVVDVTTLDKNGDDIATITLYEHDLIRRKSVQRKIDRLYDETLDALEED